jgi:AraC-like DNA-binding protein
MQVPAALQLDVQHGTALLYSSAESTRESRAWATTLNIALEGTIEVETADGRVRGRVVLTPAGLERRSTSRGPVLTVLLDGDDHRASWQPFQSRAPVKLDAHRAAWRVADLADSLCRGRRLPGADVLQALSGLLPVGRCAVPDERLEHLLRELRRADTLDRPLKTAARSLGLTPEWLSERFSQVVGLPLKRWVLWERTRRSLARLSADSGASMALDAGFADQAHMVRTFSRQLAYTPGALQRAARR